MGPQALPVPQLHRIKARAGALQMAGLEVGGHFRQREQGRLATRMAKAKQVIADRRGAVARFAQLTERLGASALGQRRAVRADEQREVTVARRAHPECLEHQQLARRVGQMVFAAQGMRDAHQRIIHGVGKEECGRTVFTADDKIADVGAIDLLRTMNEIIEDQLPIARHPKPQRGRRAGGEAAGDFARIELRTGSGVARRPARGQLRPTAEFKFLAAAEARIGG